jgi:hypothetical protein
MQKPEDSMPETIDQALDILCHTGPEFGGGLSNHGPMVAEALVVLGRPEAVAGWVDGYRTRLQDRPEAHRAIARADWQGALGDFQRAGDWITFFDEELGDTPWQEVVKTWVPRLAPGLMAGATHGLIRTAHAVRSLAGGETPQRIHELAQGLAYWAARFQTLPGSPSGKDAGYRPGEAIEHVHRIHGPGFRARGLIFEQVKGLDNEPSFAGVIDLVSTEGDLLAFVSALTETFAGVYLANQAHLIAFVHTVTAPSALRILASYLRDADVRLAARYAWQACAAIYAWYDNSSSQSGPALAAPDEPVDELIDCAIATGDVHAIKFVEVCLREYRANPKPIYLVAALDGSDRLGARS